MKLAPSDPRREPLMEEMLEANPYHPDVLQNPRVAGGGWSRVPRRMNGESSSPLAERRWVPLALALGLTAVFFHRALFSDDVFFVRDLQRVYVPLREYWRARVLGGGFPEWYPLDGLGQPFIGMVISGAFHPANLLALVLPVPQALAWNTLLCFPAAFLGLHCLGRRLGLAPLPALLSAVLFTFSGYLVGITNNLLYLMAAATVPWALWAVEGFLSRPSAWRALGAAVLLSLLLFAGDVQAYGITFGVVLVWSACRPAPEGRARSLGLALGVLGASVLFSAVQLLPAMGVLAEVRASSQKAGDAMVWSLHPLRLLELFLGPLFSEDAGERVMTAISRRLLSTSMTTLWVDSLFIGAPALVLAGLALAAHGRRARTAVLAGGTLLLLLLALGKHAKLYEWVFILFPPWRTFRYPEKLMPFVTLALALAAGVGLQQLEREPVHRRRVWGGSLAAGALLLIAGLLEWRAGLFSGWISGLWEGQPLAEAQQRIGEKLAAGCFLSGLSLVLLGGVLARVRSAAGRDWLIGALCFGGLLLANGSVYEVGDPALLETAPPFVQRIQEDVKARGGEPVRVFRLPGRFYLPEPAPGSPAETHALVTAAALEPLVPATFGLESASATLPAVSRRVISLWDQQKEWFFQYGKLFNTRYVSISREFAQQAVNGPRRVVDKMEGLGLLLLEDTSALPRVYLAHPRCVASQEEAVRRLAGTFQPGREAVVECGSPLHEAPADAPVGAVSAARFEPERVEVEVKALGGEVLVLNDAYYRGWTATVDEAPAPILPANGAVRAVVVPEGAHRVVFRYRTPGLAAGAGVSVGILLVLLGWGLAQHLRQRQARDTSAGGG